MALLIDEAAKRETPRSDQQVSPQAVFEFDGNADLTVQLTDVDRIPLMTMTEDNLSDTELAKRLIEFPHRGDFEHRP